jgi:hypothetical protein
LFPFGIGLGLTSSEDNEGTTIEITLADKESCESAVASPIVINEVTFHASPAVHPDQALLRVNLTKLPIWNLDKLRNSLMNNLSRYGIVREIVIYLDDCSGSWFTGNGHVYIERPIQNDKTFENLSYKIPLEAERTFCLGTWTNMGKHCVYCKDTGHYRKECTKAPEEKRRCFQCGNTGHIARNCFRTKGDDSTSSKRKRESRNPPHPASTLNVNTVLPATPSIAAVVLVDTPIAVNDATINLDPEDATLDTGANIDEIDESTNTVVQQGSTVETRLIHGPEASSSRPRRTNAGYNPTLYDFVVPTITKPCKCGGKDHQKTNSAKCPLNKKNLEKIQNSTSIDMIPVGTTINEAQMFEVPVTMNAMEED